MGFKIYVKIVLIFVKQIWGDKNEVALKIAIDSVGFLILLPHLFYKGGTNSPISCRENVFFFSPRWGIELICPGTDSEKHHPAK